MALSAEDEARRDQLRQKWGLEEPVVEEPAAPAPGRSEELQKKWGIDVAALREPTPQEKSREEIREGVTVGRALKHALTGFPEGLGDTANIPAMVSDLSPTFNIPQAVVETAETGELPSYGDLMGGYDDPRFRVPETTSFLKRLPGGQAVDEFVAPELSQEEIEASPLGTAAQFARTGLEWFQPGGAVKGIVKTVDKAADVITSPVVDDAIMATAAATGEMLGNLANETGGTVGEILGGISAALINWKRGRPSSLTKEEEAAIQIIEDNLTGDQTLEEVVTTLQQADAAGEAGTVGDLTRNTGVMRIEESLKSNDQQYADDLLALGRARDAQIRDEVTIPFRRVEGEEVVPPLRPLADETGVPTRDPSREAAGAEVESRAQAIERAMTEEKVAAADAAGETQRGIETEIVNVQSREIPSADPAVQKAQAEQLRSGEASRATDAARQQEAAAQAAQGRLTIEQISEQVPVTMRDEVFAGIPPEDLVARQAAANDYWRNTAFNEVKQSDIKFKLPEETQKRIVEYLQLPDVMVPFQNELGKTIEATRRAQGAGAANKLDFVDENGVLDYQAYMDAVLNGEMSGAGIMALRNFFAGSDVGSYVKWELDDAIKSQLPTEDAAKYTEQMNIYPQHLTQRNLADQNQVYLSRGQNTPEQRVTAGKPFDRPGGEQDIASYENINQAQQSVKEAERLEKAAAREAAQADTAARRAQAQEQREIGKRDTEERKLDTQLTRAQAEEARELARIESEAGKQQTALEKSLLAEYKKGGNEFLRKMVGDPNGGEKLGDLYRSMTDLGERDAFRQEIARELLRTISDGKGRVLPKSTDKFNDLRNTLYESGMLEGDDLLEIQAAIDKTVTDTLRADVSGNIKKPTKDEINDLTSAAVAALAVNLAPGDSTSLIMGGSIRKMINNHLNGLSNDPEGILKAAQDITRNPKAFISATERAKTAEEAVRLFTQQWVAAGQVMSELEN